MIILIMKRQLLKYRIVKLCIYLLLLYRSSYIVSTLELIERIDRHFLFKNRREIVSKIIRRELNSKDSTGTCLLSNEYPLVSNNNNHIEIERNEKSNSVTVSFSIRENYINRYGIYLVYTNDNNMLTKLEQRIINSPIENWKVEPNWYRFSGRLSTDLY